MIISPSSKLKRFGIAVLAALTISTCVPCEAATRPAASARFTDVQAAVNAAARGDTVVVPAGSVDWGSNTLTLTKGVRLFGSGRDNTIIGRSNAAGNAIDIEPDLIARNTSEEFRIEGFTFKESEYAINANAPWGNGFAVPKFAIGWNRFVDIANSTIFLRGQPRGVVYKNEFDKCNRPLGAFGYGYVEEWYWFPFAFGSADNLYFEDNYIHFSSPSHLSTGGWLEGGRSGRFAVRYNIWDFKNSLDNGEALDMHGFAGFNTNTLGQTGGMVAEFYGNTIHNHYGATVVKHRGGWGLYFNNIIDAIPGSGAAMALSQYEQGCTSDVEAYASAHGMPVPLPFNAALNNTYGFNNYVNGTDKPWSTIYTYCGITAGVSYYGFNSSFGNDENGIGRGTSAPVTTGNPDGAAYWMCSTTTATTDPSIVQTGHLWKRIAGAWVDFYHPYTYPHPLRDSEPTPSPAPAPPSGLHVVPHA